MLRFFGSTNKILPKKVTIIMLILAYLLLALINVSLPVTFFNDGLDANEKSTIVLLVVYFFCTLIFGLIVNRIATLLQVVIDHSQDRSLTTAAAASG